MIGSRKCFGNTHSRGETLARPLRPRFYTRGETRRHQWQRQQIAPSARHPPHNATVRIGRTRTRVSAALSSSALRAESGSSRIASGHVFWRTLSAADARDATHYILEWKSARCAARRGATPRRTHETPRKRNAVWRIGLLCRLHCARVASRLVRLFCSAREQCRGQTRSEAQTLNT